MKTDTTTLIESLEILARDIQSGDGVAAAAIFEAAVRLRELQGDLLKAMPYVDDGIQMAFDIDRHGLGQLRVHDFENDLWFQCVAQRVGYESNYHPRTKVQL